MHQSCSAGRTISSQAKWFRCGKMQSRHCDACKVGYRLSLKPSTSHYGEWGACSSSSRCYNNGLTNVCTFVQLPLVKSLTSCNIIIISASSDWLDNTHRWWSDGCWSNISRRHQHLKGQISLYNHQLRSSTSLAGLHLSVNVMNV